MDNLVIYLSFGNYYCQYGLWLFQIGAGGFILADLATRMRHSLEWSWWGRRAIVHLTQFSAAWTAGFGLLLGWMIPGMLYWGDGADLWWGGMSGLLLAALALAAIWNAGCWGRKVGKLSLTFLVGTWIGLPLLLFCFDQAWTVPDTGNTPGAAFARWGPALEPPWPFLEKVYLLDAGDSAGERRITAAVFAALRTGGIPVELISRGDLPVVVASGQELVVQIRRISGPAPGSLWRFPVIPSLQAMAERRYLVAALPESNGYQISLFGRMGSFFGGLTVPGFYDRTLVVSKVPANAAAERRAGAQWGRELAVELGRLRTTEQLKLPPEPKPEAVRPLLTLSGLKNLRPVAQFRTQDDLYARDLYTFTPGDRDRDRAAILRALGEGSRDYSRKDSDRWYLDNPVTRLGATCYYAPEAGWGKRRSPVLLDICHFPPEAMFTTPNLQRIEQLKNFNMDTFLLSGGLVYLPEREQGMALAEFSRRRTWRLGEVWRILYDILRFKAVPDAAVQSWYRKQFELASAEFDDPRNAALRRQYERGVWILTSRPWQKSLRQELIRRSPGETREINLQKLPIGNDGLIRWETDFRCPADRAWQVRYLFRLPDSRYGEALVDLQGGPVARGMLILTNSSGVRSHLPAGKPFFMNGEWRCQTRNGRDFCHDYNMAIKSGTAEPVKPEQNGVLTATIQGDVLTGKGKLIVYMRPMSQLDK